MKLRLTLITEIIAPYRVPVFNALAARPDVDLQVVFLAETDPTLRQWTVPRNEIRFFYIVLPSYRLRTGNSNLLLNRGLSRVLQMTRPEVILCGGYNYPASWRAAFWAKRHGIPFLLWTESNAADYRSGNHFLESLKRKFLSLCHGFVVPGKASQEYLQQLGAAPAAIYTAPDAVDNESFAAQSQRARDNRSEIRNRRGLPERYFLNVGRLVPVKGVLDLLEAYSQLDENIRESVGLVFVGDGVLKPELLARASRVSPGKVQACGFIQKEELAEFYALADAFVFPTRSDPWGLVVNEAMACALPVIATDVAGCVPDLVENGANGYVVPAANVSALAAAMTSMATNADHRSRMGQRSFEKIALNSPEACAAGMAEAAIAVSRSSLNSSTS